MRRAFVIKVVTFGLSMVAWGQAAHAIVIDFEGLAVTNGGLLQPTYTESGVTFSSTAAGGGLGTFNLANSGVSIIGLTSTGGFAPVRADIAGGATMVSVLLGDNSTDTDDVLLEAFDSSGTLLDSQTATIGNGFVTLTVSALMSYVVWSSPGNISHSIVADTFIFETVRVPEPGTLGLLGIGLAGIGLAGIGFARRRRKAA